ncbi:MAG TPA: metal ABC transporter permease [Candidatus Dormibacteraeota bacterium]
MPLTDLGSPPQPSFDLWGDLQQLLQFHFMQNALEAGTIVAVVAGLIGYFMVLRGQSFAGHTLSQVGFPGAAGAALLGVTPALGLLVFCVATALGIATLSDAHSQERRAESAAIGSILAFLLATGFLFATLYSGFIDGVYAFLFGTFVGITDSQVAMLLLVALVAVSVLAVIGRPLLFASVDPDVAAARGVPVRLLAVTFLVLLGLAVAEAAQITGTLLVFALLVAPAATAQQLTARPGLGLALTVAIALLVTWLGLSVAYFTIYPIGFFVTTFAFTAYLIARAVRWGTGIAGRHGAALA